MCHEFIKGWDLDHWLVNFGPIGEQLGSFFVKDLFSYVNYLHQNNISHNNLFNKSILLCQSSFQIKLTNFENIYKPEYCTFYQDMCKKVNINPEEDLTDFDNFKPSDIFNLGQIVFQMITGSLPFSSYFCKESKKFIPDPSCPYRQLINDRKYDDYWFLLDPYKKLTSNFRTLIMKMLIQDQSVTMEMLLNDKWLTTAPTY